MNGGALMNKTIVAPAYLHETMLHDLLDHHHTDALGSISVVPFSALLNKSKITESEVFEQVYDRILHIKSLCPHFTDMIDNPSFLKQLVDFRKEMTEYNISLDELPIEDDFQKELKILIESFYDIAITIQPQIDFLHQVSDYSNIKMTPFYQHTLFDGASFQHLLKNGASLMNFSAAHPSLSGRIAVNRRQEAEACAQYILKHQLEPKDINIVLCDSSSDQNVLKLVFERYGLPFGFTNLSIGSQIVRLFLSLASYLHDSSIESFIDYLHAAYYHIEHFDALISYINYFITSPEELLQPLTHVKDSLESDIILDQRDQQKFIELEEHAEIVRQQIQISFEAPVFESAYEFCRAHSLIKNEDELKVLYRIKQILEDHTAVLTNSDYYHLICFEIESLSIHKTESIINRICVTDLTHPVPARKYGFVLGCIQSSFPNFTSCSGIFDEDYVQRIPSYPSKTERQRFNAENTSWIFKCADQIIFSASSSDYEGKGRQMSVEIESRLDGKPIPWEIIQHQKKHSLDFSISKDTASKLFLKYGSLNGSISSFERWFHCPASYFLSHGLKIRESKLPEFNIAMIGTLQHAVLEEVLTKYHKDISLLSEQQLSEIIDHIFNPVIHLFKKQESLLTATKMRCLRNMTIIFEFLNEMESNTDFEPYAVEKHFKKTLNEDHEVPVVIQGIIDRIDMTHDMIRILDYKSSHKTLSVSKIQSGLQLQLLTYLHIASCIYQKNAAGCYYVSIKNDDIKAEISKVDGRKFEIIDPDKSNERALWVQSNRLDGMTFENTNMLDFDGTHIKNFKNGRPSKIYLIEDLDGLITTIYDYLATQVSSGNISLTPTDDACTFCETFSICRFHSLKVKSIVPSELTSHFFKEVKKS